jgi:hypothetical protein
VSYRLFENLEGDVDECLILSFEWLMLNVEACIGFDD